MIDINYRPKSKKALKQCMGDKAWRLNNLYHIINEAGQKVKFHLRPPQLKFLLERHGLDDILKSRQHGFSTLIDLDILDDVLFLPDLRCGIIAQTRDHAQTIFNDKVQFPYRCLLQEPWIGDMIPKVGKNGKNDAGELRLENNSSVRVGTSFRSATVHRLHISEYGKICAKFPDRAKEIQTGTLPAVHPQEGGRITVESTAEGAAGAYYDLCQASRAETKQADMEWRELNPRQYRFHFYAWHEDAKNQVEPTGISISDKLLDYYDELHAKHGIKLTTQQKAWYAITCEGANGLGQLMKREHPSTVDEAFEQAVEGAVYSEEMTQAYDDGRIGRVPATRSAPVYTFWDLGISKGNATAILFVQFIQQWIHIVDYYEVENRAMGFHASQVLNRGYQYSRGYPFAYMPHDVAKRDMGTGVPTLDIAEECGLSVERVQAPKDKFQDGIQAVKKVFQYIKIDNRCLKSEQGHWEGADRLIKALSYYRYKWDEDLLQWSKKPIHDWASNGCDALQTMALAHQYMEIGGEYIGTLSPAQKYVVTENYEGVGVSDLLSFD